VEDDILEGFFSRIAVVILRNVIVMNHELSHKSNLAELEWYAFAIARL